MRVTMVAVGSRGDVAPYTGLGQRLQAAGHEVTLATHDEFVDVVRRAGLEFASLPLDIRAALGGNDGAGGTSPLALRRTMSMFADHYRALGTAILSAARDSELLILSPMGWLGWHVAEGLGIPSLGAYLQPWDPTGDFPPASLTTRSLGSWGNKAATRLVRTSGQWPARQVVNDLRREVGLGSTRPGAMFAEMEATRWPIYYGYSTAVVPTPGDWPSWHPAVGYWWPASDPAWEPATDLVDFLAAGPAPVYVGFGSMATDDAGRLGDIVRDALRRTGVRAVLHSGWAGLEDHSDAVLTIDQVPHEWLFPQMSAVVHHAGAGTSAAGLRAGVPTVPVPVMVDQPFWADRLARLGAAAPPIPWKRLTADRLGAALTRVTTDPSFRMRSGEIAARLSTEDGAAHVVDAVARLADGRRLPPSG